MRDFWKGHRDGVLIAVVVFLSLALWFMLLGVPMWLARATGWADARSIRVIPGVGVASIVGLVHISVCRPEKSEGKKIWLLSGALGLALILFGCLFAANSGIGNFARPTEVTAAAIFFAAVFCLIWQRQRLVCGVLLLIPLLWASPLVNPIGRGLPGFARSETFHWLSDAHRSDPGARWIVVGNPTKRTCYLAQFVKATGADVLGGDTVHAGSRDDRCLGSGEPIRVCAQSLCPGLLYSFGGKPEPEFKLVFADAYQVQLPWRSEVFQKLGVKYILVVYRTEVPALPQFEQIATQTGLVLLRRQ